MHRLHLQFFMLRLIATEYKFMTSLRDWRFQLDVDYNEEIWSFLQCVVNTVASKNQHQSLAKVFQPNLAKNTASMKIVSRNLIIIVFCCFRRLLVRLMQTTLTSAVCLQQQLLTRYLTPHCMKLYMKSTFLSSHCQNQFSLALLATLLVQADQVLSTMSGDVVLTTSFTFSFVFHSHCRLGMVPQNSFLGNFYDHWRSEGGAGRTGR